MKGRRDQVCIHHVAMQTACFVEAFQFYTELLGLQVLKKPFRYKKRSLAWLDAGGTLVELYSVKDGEEPQVYDDRQVGVAHIAFEVQDLDATVSYLSGHNVKILKQPFLPPVDEPNQPRVAFIEGPDGEEIELRERPVENLIYNDRGG
jgi:glyoxylase I family protein